MKKILILLFSVLLAISVLTAAGCGNSNEIVENSLNYTINTRSSLHDDVDGSFEIKVNSGIVRNVTFIVKGFDKNGNELWSKNFDNDYRGLKSQDDPYTIKFSCSYWYDDYGPERTNTITVTDIRLIKENSNEWMGWTFGAVSALATAAVIAVFALSKKKLSQETPTEDSEEA